MLIATRSGLNAVRRSRRQEATSASKHRSTSSLSCRSGVAAMTYNSPSGVTALGICSWLPDTKAIFMSCAGCHKFLTCEYNNTLHRQNRVYVFPTRPRASWTNTQNPQYVDIVKGG